jgi:ribulose-phosphate 3-epimerase
MLPKIQQLRHMITAIGRAIHLQVDGGVDVTTAPLCRAAGADVFVAASAVYKAGKPVAEAIAELRGA